jgi:hypothetical protein
VQGWGCSRGETEDEFAPFGLATHRSLLMRAATSCTDCTHALSKTADWLAHPGFCAMRYPARVSRSSYSAECFAAARGPNVGPLSCALEQFLFVQPARSYAEFHSSLHKRGSVGWPLPFPRGPYVPDVGPRSARGQPVEPAIGIQPTFAELKEALAQSEPLVSVRPGAVWLREGYG